MLGVPIDVGTPYIGSKTLETSPVDACVTTISRGCVLMYKVSNWGEALVWSRPSAAEPRFGYRSPPGFHLFFDFAKLWFQLF